MKQSCEMWAVVSDKRGIIYHSLAVSEEDSILFFLDWEDDFEEWEEYVAAGFRCVKVEVREI